MKLLIVGASGRTGRLLAELAVARSHSVTALVRPGTTPTFSASIRVVVGNPTNHIDFTSALDGQDAVISCLGQKFSADSLLLRTASGVAIESMQSSPVRRYVVISQGLLFPTHNPLIRLVRLILARHVADSIGMEKVVSASSLDWTIARPPRLLEGGTARGYRVAIGARPIGKSSMQRLDLAAYLLDVVEQGQHVQAIVGVAGA